MLMNNSIVLIVIKNLLPISENKIYFSKLKSKYPSDAEIEQTKEIIKKLNIKNGEEINKVILKK